MEKKHTIYIIINIINLINIMDMGMNIHMGMDMDMSMDMNIAMAIKNITSIMDIMNIMNIMVDIITNAMAIATVPKENHLQVQVLNVYDLNQKENNPNQNLVLAITVEKVLIPNINTIEDIMEVGMKNLCI
jgi:hypothetical protein